MNFTLPLVITITRQSKILEAFSSQGSFLDLLSSMCDCLQLNIHLHFFLLESIGMRIAGGVFASMFACLPVKTCSFPSRSSPPCRGPNVVTFCFIVLTRHFFNPTLVMPMNMFMSSIRCDNKPEVLHYL